MPGYHPRVCGSLLPTCRQGRDRVGRPAGPGRVGQSCFLRTDLSWNFFQDLRPTGPAQTLQHCLLPRWPGDGQGCRVRGLTATPENRNQVGPTAAYNSGREHKLRMLNHTEMHLDNKMRKREGHEEGLGRDGEEEGEGGKGG